MTAHTPTAAPAAAEIALPPIDRRPLRQVRVRRAAQQVAAVALTVFMAAPIYLITLAALSSRSEHNRFPKAVWPRDPSTETLQGFLGATGVVPLFLNAGIYDSILAVTLVHSALALPTTVLITASVFVAVPVDLEEAALIFGCTRFGAFRRVIAPMALPGIAAASIFTFVLSWNEILGAAVLTLANRTLPAQVLTSLSYSPVYYRFAGGFALVVPAVLFILVMRRYLLNMWGSTIR